MELNFKSYGEGAPIIIMHGMFGMLDNWQLIGKQLAGHYLVYLLDLRNHGRSPHSEDFSYELMAEDLHDFMDGQGIRTATILGHSMGGKVAMYFAQEYYAMVEKLVIVDIAPKTYKGNHDTILKALLDFPLGQIESRQEAENFLRSRINEESTVQFLLKNLSREKEGGYRWKMNLEVIVKHYQEILGYTLGEDILYEGPTLFVRGETSNYIELDEFPLYKRLFPTAELVNIAGAGHWVHAEQPAAFLQAIEAFLNKP